MTSVNVYYYVDKIKEKNRPKIREAALKHGLSFPFDEDLVCLILGSGSKNMSVEVMAKKIVETIDKSNPDEIVNNLLLLKGIGQGKALAVAAALELGKRRSSHLRAPIRSPCDVLPFVRNYAVNKKEHFIAVNLSGSHEIINIHVVTVGTVNRVLVHPREVFEEAIRVNAAAVILCHNHPSGNCDPSIEDVETTRVLLDSSYILGISILDHLIIDCENYFSFLEHKLLFSDED